MANPNDEDYNEYFTAMVNHREPVPKGGKRIVYIELIKDIKSRAEFGKKKYGQHLTTHDGRNTLLDAYQEAIDLCFYLKQLLMEKEE